MPKTGLGYRALAAAVDRLLPLARPFSAKLAAGDRGRRGALRRFEAWSRAHRDPGRRLLWCHAPSVGEGLQARAVLRLLRAARPDWQIAYTFFSPSAAALAAGQPADVADYLPYDTGANVDRMLAALAPTAVVFTKLDLWPELATRARARGARVGMIAATVSPVSGRLRSPARALTLPGYAALELVGAVAAADAGRLRGLGAPPAGIRITGDPRFDSALDVVRSLPADDPLLRFGAGGPTLVAGSTWGPDEAVLLPAFAALRRVRPDARLIVVPHEPTPDHLAALEALARSLGLDPVRLSVAAGPVPLLIVDRVGVLAGLYRAGAVGYVGGGFGRAGLHSVLEPAAARVPVLFGPRWHASREAGLLLEAGAAVALPAPRQGATTELGRVWENWLADPAGLAERGRRAEQVVTSGLGAAERNAALVVELMGLG